jgi:hypothetical protein
MTNLDKEMINILSDLKFIVNSLNASDFDRVHKSAYMLGYTRKLHCKVKQLLKENGFEFEPENAPPL